MRQFLSVSLSTLALAAAFFPAASAAPLEVGRRDPVNVSPASGGEIPPSQPVHISPASGGEAVPTTEDLRAKQLLARDTQPFCQGDENAAHLFTTWTVRIPDDTRFDTGGCGKGFLDNFRGKCGVITDFSCVNIGNSPDIQMTFETTIFCSPEDIAGAAKAASNNVIQLDCGGP